MRVLILGNDARSHCIAWKLYQSEYVKKLYAYPGNPGIFSMCEKTSINSESFEEIYDFCRKKQINSVFVGPEKYLCDGIFNYLKERNINVFGPSKDAAKLEGSKSFAKNFMEKYGIPTASYSEFETKEKALEYAEKTEYPIVVKYDGLAQGKGVAVCRKKDEAVNHIYSFKTGKFIIEEFLDGKEASLLCFTDGNTIKPMIYARDFKRAEDNDKGLNTGGMGAFTNPDILPEHKQSVIKNIVEPTLEGIKSEEFEYTGVIYIGLIFTEKGPKVIEYNVRFGDPETQVLIPTLKTDLGLIMNKIFTRTLNDLKIEWKEKQAVCVVLASNGYPEKYETDKKISINKSVKALVFMAGVKENHRSLYTSGGRVISVVAMAKEREEARRIAYQELNKVYFDNMYYRKDIAQ
ncbi:MAG: phosphoribosylamine--glycine ligase [Candidatus Muiribacteriota bacterium]